MKKTKSVLAIAVVALIVAISGCQPTPEQSAVIRKNDGVMEAAPEGVQSVEVEENVIGSKVGGLYTDGFTNMDGDISFQVELDVPVVTTKMPVLRVRQKTITSDCANRLARVPFGNADIYEHSENWSKANLSCGLQGANRLLDKVA